MKISQVTLALLLTIAIASRVEAAIASWDPNTEPDVAGYLLSYGTQPGEHLSTIDVGNVTTVQFNPEPGRRYYVVVRAYNFSGYLSEKSSEATIDIPGPNSPPPPPSTSATSPNNALVPPLANIVDSTGGVWTLGPNAETLRNGEPQHGGRGTKLLWYNGVVYTYGLDGSWYRFDNGWIRLNTTEQPGTVTPSPNNALVPPLTQIVDATGGVWTLGPNAETLRNGVHQHGGRGTKLLWYDGVVYTYGFDGSWYRFDNGWIRLSTTEQPGTATPPPPPPPGEVL